jgi:hypothetical protein
MSSDDEILLRDVFATDIDEFKLDVLYIRLSKYIKCVCYNNLYHTGVDTCPYCGGTGKVTTVEKLRALCHATDIYFQMATYKRTDVGDISKENEIIYVDYNKDPSPKDLICIVGWDAHGKPTNVVKVYEIIYSEPVRGEDGMIILNMLATVSRPDLITLVSNQIPKIHNYQYAKGVQYLWAT